METLQRYTPPSSATVGNTLAEHKVLRSTYALLSMTLLFSAAISAVAVATSAPALPWWGTLAGNIGLLFLVYKLRNSAAGLLATFAFTGFLGYSIGPMIEATLRFANGAEIVTMSLVGTGAAFLGLSAYVLKTGKDFRFLSGFVFVGMIVVILAGIAAIVFSLPAVSLAVSAASVLLMSAFILYETSNIVHGGETNYIMATVSLYTSIFNLFVSLLHLLGFGMGEE
jgi:modulator of FtsH protease